MIRLDKYLADMGVGTRTSVKEIIKKGRVKVNDIVVKKSDTKIIDTDQVKVDDQVVSYQIFEYYLLNKPAGYLTATYDKDQPVVMELINAKRKDLSPVGRLDKDTEGVLLITTDGVLAHHLIAPKYHVPKQYYAEVDCDLPTNAKEVFMQPMEFKDFIADPAQDYKQIAARKAYLTIGEGKYHQVKRMFKQIGCEVTYLRRMSFAFLTADGLKTGEARPLSEEEINQLYALVDLQRESSF